MIRRAVAILGLLLVPLPALAAALSPWVQGVLDRADAGIAMGVPEVEGAVCTPEGQKLLAKDTQQFARDYIDIRLAVSRRSEYLRDWTVCYQSDVRLIEQKLDQILQAAVGASQACLGVKQGQLKKTFTFVADAYQALLSGGLLPSFHDDRLKKDYDFHDRALWDQGIESRDRENSADPVCPFTTDFSPHSIADPLASAAGLSINADRGDPEAKSYGCDLSVMQALPDAIEAPVMAQFVTTTQIFAQALAEQVTLFLWNLSHAIAALRHYPPPTGEIDPSLPPPPHARIDGCLQPLTLTYDGGNAAAFEAVLGDYPEYYVTPQPPVERALPGGLLLQPAYDSFSIFPDPVSVSERFVRRRGVQGATRPIPGRFAQPFSDFLMTFTLLFTAPRDYRTIGENVDKQGGVLEAMGRDGYLRMADAFSPLRVAVNDIAKATENTVPKYITDLGYFLRRQCVDGYCKETLENVIRRSINPACHPYVSGQFTGGNSVNQCFCIPDPENPIDPKDPYCGWEYDAGEYAGRPPEFVEGCTIPADPVPQRSSSSAGGPGV